MKVCMGCGRVGQRREGGRRRELGSCGEGMPQVFPAVCWWCGRSNRMGWVGAFVAWGGGSGERREVSWAHGFGTEGVRGAGAGMFGMALM